MVVETVTVIAGTETSIGEGLTGAARCLVRFSDGTTRAAIVKQLPEESVVAELFCAILLRAWGLAVPQPALVAGPPIAFASVELTYPNLKHRIGWSDTLPPAIQAVLIAQGSKLVTGFSQTPLAIAADEAINNRDRHFGNILWDGNDVAWIDHDQVLTVGTLPSANKLANIAVLSGDHVRIQQAAVAVSLSLARDAIAAAQSECSELAGVDNFVEYVSTKVQSLASHVIARFPQPDDLLGAANV